MEDSSTHSHYILHPNSSVEVVDADYGVLRMMPHTVP
jgi:hypothetical protein